MRRPFFVICLLISVVSTIACAEEIEDPMLKQLIEAVETRIGSLEIRGRVVNTDGESLNDVTIDYFFREFGDVLTRKEVVRKTIIIDGVFTIRKRDFSSVNLWVAKEGYYPEHWSYTFDEEIQREDASDLETVDVVFTLEKIPYATDLIEYEGILRTDSSGVVAVVEVERTGGRETFLRKNDQRVEIDWPYVYLEVPVDDSGAFVTVKYVPQGERAEIDVLEKAWINFSHPKPGDGFVVYEPGEMRSRISHVFREMVEAPMSGYTDELEIPVENSPETVFFYCRFRGRYGKGKISGQAAVVVGAERQQAVAAITVYFNPTGSQNVAYVHN